MSIQSPGIIDLSGDSGEEFVVQPYNLIDLEGRFRVCRPKSDMMTAFLGAASATRFASESEDPAISEIFQIERQMKDIIEEHHISRESPSTSFVDTELEDSPMSPWEPSRPMHVPVNNYGPPTAAILPTPRNGNHGTTTINRPISTYPTNFAVNNSAFQTQQPVDLEHQQVLRQPNENQTRLVNPNGAVISSQNNLRMYNNAPLMIQIPPHERSLHIPQLNGGPNPVSLPNFPFQVCHSTNQLLLPRHERQMYRLLPTVMPNVAGFCD